MKHLFTILAALMLGSTGFAQINQYHVLSPAGFFSSTPQGSASSTIGELALISTFTGGNHIMTQGFQQGDMIKILPLALPVTLLDFEGSNINDVDHLTWQTASEINNVGFDIERLNAKNEYDKIGFVAGHRNSNSLQDYSFDDKQPQDGENYYRLKQTDVDGNSTYSDIISIYAGHSSGIAISIYPMPVTDFVNISIHNKEVVTGHMTISNVMGAIMYDGPIDIVNGTTASLIDMRSYAAGQYFLRLTTGATTQTTHIVRQ